MKRYDKTTLDKQLIAEVQEGLQSLERARLRLQQLFTTCSDSIDEKVTQELVESVLDQIKSIVGKIVQIEDTGQANGSLKLTANKLRNDVVKEQKEILKLSRKFTSSTSSTYSPQNSPDKKRSEIRNSIINRGKPNSKARSPKGKSDPCNSTVSLNYEYPETTKAPMYPDNTSCTPSLVQNQQQQQQQQQQNLKFEQEIGSKLILVDESSIAAAIIEERSISIEKIRKDLSQIRDMYIHLSNIVEVTFFSIFHMLPFFNTLKLQQVQQEYIDTVDSNIRDCHGTTEEALRQLQTAAVIQQRRDYNGVSRCRIS